jgi:NAD(P)-dependent dehydrogenase (short-subunit alcohol dehydrogenase family)
MSGRFTEQVVWITGGGSGIGKALALELAAQGAHVAISGRRREALEAVVAAIEAKGRRGLAVVCDVCDEAALEATVRTVVATFGRLDVAVANAGFSVSGPIERVGAAEWRRQLEVNVVGAAMTARYALPELKETRGRLVLVGSVMGSVTAPLNGPYAASKWAVRGLAQTLSMELWGTGVSCTLVQPGFVESDIARVDNAGVLHPEREDRRPAKLMWTAERAARKIARAIHRRKREYTFPFYGKAAAFLGRHAPGLVWLAVTRFGGNARAKRLDKSSG